MGSVSLPPGFRFHPTDEELIGYYLKRQVEGLQFELQVIPVIDLYKFDPWQLPEKSFLPNRDMEWFFFSCQSRKYPNGSRTNRATKAGYWKATGKDRKIACQSSVCGFRKTLVFYRGRAPLGDRSEWMMHEYRLCDDDTLNPQGGFALCRVIKKNESTQKRRDSFNWDPNANRVENRSRDGEISSRETLNEPILTTSPNLLVGMAHITGDFEPPLMGDSPSLWVSPDMILDSSEGYSLGQDSFSHYFSQNVFPIPPACANFTGEVELVDNFNNIGCVSQYTMHGYDAQQYLPNIHDYGTSERFDNSL